MPNVKLGRLKVAITSLLMTLGGGKRKESCEMVMIPDNSLLVACGDVVLVVAT